MDTAEGDRGIPVKVAAPRRVIGRLEDKFSQ